jgi:sec-independent protein translocase protein TatB
VFDIGFAELVIIAVVALLVIGPERLPEALRTGSAWLNRLRRGFNEIKQEVQQELHNDAVLRDLRESGERLRRETESLRDDLEGKVRETDAELRADAKQAIEQTQESKDTTQTTDEKRQ